ncbi:hypothetical protein A0H81_08809 [Grifola frondosa]|uniref:Uncharacterized protein n=1 Tax=Grifola frondosa TaxID=5627 RepID=A0A1C7M4N9_GRIFR|nr:hypothetical protein A0H81_08809 [Grifola frondosa]
MYAVSFRLAERKSELDLPRFTFAPGNTKQTTGVGNRSYGGSDSKSNFTNTDMVLAIRECNAAARIRGTGRGESTTLTRTDHGRVIDAV